MEVLFVGGGSCGLTGTWLLENQEGINVTLAEKGPKLGGHIDTRRYQCTTELLTREPTSDEIMQVKSLSHILFIRQGDQYYVGFCNAEGEYEQAPVTDPYLLEFLRKTSPGSFIIQGDNIKPFNALLKQVKSCQRVSVYVVETGAEFIGDKRSYPLFNIICDHLGVQLRPFDLTAQLDATNGHTILLPPKIHGIEKTKHDDLFFKGQNLPIFDEFLALFNTLFVEIGARRTLKKSHPIMSLEEFVTSFIEAGGIESIKQQRKEYADMFLYPLLAAGWGVSIEDIKQFRAHYAMNYLSLGERWIDVPEGLDTYLQKMKDQCKQADIRMNTEVTSLEPVQTSTGLKYRARLKDSSFLSDKDGEIKLFDHVVIATPAENTCAIMPDTPELAELKTTLSRVRYYPTTIMTHRDPKYVSPEQYIVRTIATASGATITSANTTCKFRDYDGEVPVLRSWVLPGQTPPNNVIDEIHFRHPYMNEDYYLAQQAIHQKQGQQGLSYGNFIAGFNDSNESTQTAAVRIAAKIRALSEQQIAAAKGQTPHLAPRPQAAGAEDRFLLFKEFLHHEEVLDYGSDQLEAGMPADGAEEKPWSLCSIL